MKAQSSVGVVAAVVAWAALFATMVYLAFQR